MSCLYVWALQTASENICLKFVKLPKSVSHIRISFSFFIFILFVLFVYSIVFLYNQAMLLLSSWDYTYVFIISVYKTVYKTVYINWFN